MKVYKYSELFESGLSLPVLASPGPNGLRGDEFVRKIREEEPLKMTGTNDEIIIDKELLPNITHYGRYSPEKAKNSLSRSRVIFSVDNEDQGYLLRDIEKTSDFGGSPGAYNRSIGTKITESIQCLVLSYKQDHKRLKKSFNYEAIENLKKGEFRNYMKNVDTSIQIEPKNVSDYGEIWGSTFIKIANALYDKGMRIRRGVTKDSILKYDISYRFCHAKNTDGVVGVISTKYKELSKKMWDRSVNIDKWNPADIWAVDKSSEGVMISSIGDCTTINNLNQKIDEFFDSRRLVGISLKKVSENEEASLIVNKVVKAPKYEFSYVDLTEDPSRNMGVTIVANRSTTYTQVKKGLEKLIVRTTATKIADISGEVQGRSAMHGKIALSKINEILDYFNLDMVPLVSEIGFYNKGLEWSDDDLINQINIINSMIRTKYKKYNKGGSSSEELTNFNRRRLVSKYQSLYLSWIIMDGKKLNVNLALEEMLYYALSIKIDGTRTPKYARVIDDPKKSKS